ncbi:ABC transporter permease [Plantactinospora endophytica]|uniref:ABC transporter permease n=1 Tax=Plantactinospora endophytica TaxID=673535 RepID=A0ABQ4DZ87_9ACTN|nr:ABC transporter permease [Plantactinospora endophytica]GIG87770.1 ABC transporter permease [Plantactinospora endophytica]
MTAAPSAPQRTPAVPRREVRTLRTAVGADPARGVFVALALTLAIGWVVVALDGGQLLNQSSVVSLLHVATGLGLVAAGQTLVILGGSLDLSVGYVVSLSTLIAAETMNGSDSRIGPAILLVMAVSVAVGLVNGFLVATVGINAFIATLGVGLLLKGYLENGYDGPAGSTAPTLVQTLGYQRVGPVPVAFLLFLAVAAAIWFALRRTRYGHHLVAVGGDAQVARLSGVRNDRVLILSHVLCALCAGLAGVYLASRLGSGAPRVGVESFYDLESIAAVVLGGAALAGGRGGVVGTVGGVLLLASVDSVFNQLDVDAFFKQVVRGVIIIAAVALYARRRHRRHRERNGARS